MRVIIFFLLCFNVLYAHKLNIFLQQENDKVYVSSYYASGSFCSECKVEVFNTKNQLIQNGITNNKGEFVISELDSTLKVFVEAQGGHKVSSSLIVKTIENRNLSNKQIIFLQEENRRLKSKIKLLEEKNSLSDIVKMIFALLIIVGIFFALKRVKSEK